MRLSMSNTMPRPTLPSLRLKRSIPAIASPSVSRLLIPKAGMSRFNGQPRAAQSTTRHRSPPTSLHQPHRDPSRLHATARDADGVEGSNTHVIVVNSPPTVVITAPSQLEVGRTGNISIAVSDPNNDAVTVLLETSAGSIDNPTALSAILTAPATPQTITVTCTATDSEGLETVETAQITIVANQPPTLNITATEHIGNWTNRQPSCNGGRSDK